MAYREPLRADAIRRPDRAMTDRGELERLLDEAPVCRIGLCQGDEPYVVPVCFGYEPGRLFLHTRHEGKKMAMIRNNPKVCFEVDCGVEPLPASSPCDWGMRYRSAIGRGRARIVTDPEEQEHGLRLIIRHYTGKPADALHLPLEGIQVVCIEIESITGKKSGW